MKNFKNFVLCAFSIFAFSGSIEASIAEHNYAFGGFESYSGDASLFGYVVGGSYKVKEPFLVDASFSRANKSGFDYNQIRIGGSYLYTHQSKFDLMASVFLVSLRVKDKTKTEIGLEGRGIMQLPKDFQGEALVRLLDSRLILGAGAYYAYNRRYSFGGALEFDADFTVFKVLGRYYF